MPLLDMITTDDYYYVFFESNIVADRPRDGDIVRSYHIKIIRRNTGREKIYRFPSTRTELPRRCAIIAGIIRDHTIDAMIGDI